MCHELLISLISFYNVLVISKVKKEIEPFSIKFFGRLVILLFPKEWKVLSQLQLSPQVLLPQVLMGNVAQVKLPNKVDLMVRCNQDICLILLVVPTAQLTCWERGPNQLLLQIPATVEWESAPNPLPSRSVFKDYSTNLIVLKNEQSETIWLFAKHTHARSR